MCITVIYVVLLMSCESSDHLKGSQEHLASTTSPIGDEILQKSDNSDGDWLTYGGTYSEQRFSKLSQIKKENITDLGLAWTLNLGTKRGIQTTPIVVDGILYATGPWNIVYAIDARDGRLIWTYDPQLERETVLDLCCGVSNRGLAIYEGNLYMGTLDARLISLDASTGEVNWEVNTKDGSGRRYSITGAPRIAKGRVIIGNGGAEFDARGYVSAYDASSGVLDWRFYTVPGNPDLPFEHPDLEQAAKTWTGEWWKQGGGGTAWDAIVYDPEFNNIYVGVGNGAHWNRLIRSPEGGDNLYLSSIVALDADDGSYKWHYQTTPGDTWDYTATQHIILADLAIEGVERKVLMQAPKNGFFYVIDRTDGSLISAKAYAYMNWAKGMGEDGRPIVGENMRYEDGQIYWIAPSNQGGHNWTPMSYSPISGLVYIPSIVMSGTYVNELVPEEGLAAPMGARVSIGSKLYKPHVFDPNPDAPVPGTGHGELIAYDPIEQKKVWGVKQAHMSNGGLLSTETGLLFQGDGTGIFYARDAESGEPLWQFDVRSGVIASPVSYLVDGQQYVTIFVGWGGYLGQTTMATGANHPGTVYTFKLGGTAEPPEKLPAQVKKYNTSGTQASSNNIGEGVNLYMSYCVGCHGETGRGGGTIPDLSMSTDQVFANYETIVLDGSLLSQGMPGFADMLTEEEVQDIKSYVLYTGASLGGGMDYMECMTNLAKMQYEADVNPPIRRNIE